MKAAVLHGAMDMRYEDVAMPEPEANQVRIRVFACGVCGSDYPRITEGTAHYYPIILGHEFAGVVDAVGEGVTDFRPGDKAVAVPLIPCMECEPCRNHQYSLCEHYNFIGTRSQGGYAEYAILPATNLIKLQDNVDTKMAALLEPATVALHGIRRSEFREGSLACVVGGGTVGGFCTEWLRILGASSITVIGRDAHRLEMNRRLGAHHVFSTLDPDAAARALDASTASKPGISSAAGYDFVYETGGTPDTVKIALHLTARRGTLCLIGCIPGDITFTKQEWEQIARKEIRICGSWMSGEYPYPGADWLEAVAHLNDGSLVMDPEMIGYHVPLSEAAELPQRILDANRRKGRILIDCQE